MRKLIVATLTGSALVLSTEASAIGLLLPAVQKVEAAADVNNDGFADIITSAGSGITVYDGKAIAAAAGRGGDIDVASLRAPLMQFNTGFQGGVFVSAGDVNGDGRADIIVAAGPGGGPHVKVFDGATGRQLNNVTLPSATNYTGGVRVAVGDVNGDGRADIITDATSGGPRATRQKNRRVEMTIEFD